jgi:hypothetical protein
VDAHEDDGLVGRVHLLVRRLRRHGGGELRRRLADGRLFCRFTVEDKDQRYLLEQFMERASLLVLPYERLN